MHEPNGSSSPPRPPFLRVSGWSEAVRAPLEGWIAARGADGPVAAIDLDQTCLVGDISETALALLEEDGARGAVAAYEAACRVDLRGAFIDLVFTLLEGRTETEGRALAERALHEGGRRGVLAIRPALRELIWALHRFGWDVWVVSASPEVLVQTAAQRLGVHPRRVLAMRASLDEHGRYCRPILEPIPFLEGKLALLTAAAGRRPTLAVGDSGFDLPLLAGAERALLVDRGDPQVRAAADALGAWIQPEELIR